MPAIKMTVSLSMAHKTWRAFQGACQQRERIPSHEVQRFMQEYVATWQTQPSPPTPRRVRGTTKGPSS